MLRGLRIRGCINRHIDRLIDDSKSFRVIGQCLHDLVNTTLTNTLDSLFLQLSQVIGDRVRYHGQIGRGLDGLVIECIGLDQLLWSEDAKQVPEHVERVLRGGVGTNARAFPDMWDH